MVEQAATPEVPTGWRRLLLAGRWLGAAADRPGHKSSTELGSSFSERLMWNVNGRFRAGQRT